MCQPRLRTCARVRSTNAQCTMPYPLNHSQAPRHHAQKKTVKKAPGSQVCMYMASYFFKFTCYFAVNELLPKLGGGQPSISTARRVAMSMAWYSLSSAVRKFHASREMTMSLKYCLHQQFWEAHCGLLEAHGPYGGFHTGDTPQDNIHCGDYEPRSCVQQLQWTAFFIFFCLQPLKFGCGPVATFIQKHARKAVGSDSEVAMTSGEAGSGQTVGTKSCVWPLQLR